MQDDERTAYWRRVVELCRPMADEFMDLVESGGIRDRVEPL